MNKQLTRQILPLNSEQPTITPREAIFIIRATHDHDSSFYDLTLEDFKIIYELSHEDYVYCLDHMGLSEQSKADYEAFEHEFFNTDWDLILANEMEVTMQYAVMTEWLVDGCSTSDNTPTFFETLHEAYEYYKSIDLAYIYKTEAQTSSTRSYEHKTVSKDLYACDEYGYVFDDNSHLYYEEYSYSDYQKD